MDILSIIERKKKKEALTAQEIKYFIKGVTEGTLPNYQVSALLMAIRLNGMTAEETSDLTYEMAHSGDLLSWEGLTADKHSTGGVSDSTTFIVVPLLALLGFTVVKMSGRALGFTGGTIDKLECFKGYRAERTPSEMQRLAQTCGVSISSASKDLAPADKILYALRDVTGTVDSLPLIAASVMSKKLASGSRYIVLDVKYGDGALMRDPADACKLAELMTEIGRRNGREVGALVTSMEQPLGQYVGGNAECRGALDVLNGKRNRLYTVSRALVKRLCALAKKEVSDETIDRLIDSGAALEKFRSILAVHGGTIGDLSFAPIVTEIRAQADGYINRIATRRIGEINLMIGGGRSQLGDQVDHEVGICLFAELGVRVRRGDLLARLYTRQEASDAAVELGDCFVIEPDKMEVPSLIYQIY